MTPCNLQEVADEGFDVLGAVAMESSIVRNTIVFSVLNVNNDGGAYRLHLLV
jgi:hypothetical protein